MQSGSVEPDAASAAASFDAGAIWAGMTAWLPFGEHVADAADVCAAGWARVRSAAAFAAATAPAARALATRAAAAWRWRLARVAALELPATWRWPWAAPPGAAGAAGGAGAAPDEAVAVPKRAAAPKLSFGWGRPAAASSSPPPPPPPPRGNAGKMSGWVGSFFAGRSGAAAPGGPGAAGGATPRNAAATATKPAARTATAAGGGGTTAGAGAAGPGAEESRMSRSMRALRGLRAVVGAVFVVGTVVVVVQFYVFRSSQTAAHTRQRRRLEAIQKYRKAQEVAKAGTEPPARLRSSPVGARSKQARGFSDGDGDGDGASEGGEGGEGGEEADAVGRAVTTLVGRVTDQKALRALAALVRAEGAAGVSQLGAERAELALLALESKGVDTAAPAGDSNDNVDGITGVGVGVDTSGGASGGASGGGGGDEEGAAAAPPHPAADLLHRAGARPAMLSIGAAYPESSRLRFGGTAGDAAGAGATAPAGSIPRGVGPGPLDPARRHLAGSFAAALAPSSGTGVASPAALSAPAIRAIVPARGGDDGAYGSDEGGEFGGEINPLAHPGALDATVLHALAMPARIEAERWRRREAAAAREEMIRAICHGAGIDPSADIGGVAPGQESNYDYFAHVCRSLKCVEESLHALRAEHSVRANVCDRGEPSLPAAGMLEDVAAPGGNGSGGGGGEIVLDAEEDEVDLIKSLML